MTGVGGLEVVLLILIGLMVLGPERLPRVANQLGSWLGQARRMTRMMKRQLEEEINLDLNKELGIGPGVAANPAADVTKPAYVHDKTSQPADAGGDGEPDLPDDYSPAHDTDAVGTGVGDDDDYIDDDELEPVATTVSAEAGTTDGAPIAEDSAPAEKNKTA